MKKEYDFSAARRGPVLAVAPGKTRITIRFDDDILRWFRQQVHTAGGGNYQSLMNAALREYIDHRAHGLEDTLRVVIRQELGRYEAKRAPVARSRSNSQYLDSSVKRKVRSGHARSAPRRRG